MICKKCGENLPDNARECFTCGAKVHREEPKPQVTEATDGAPAPAPKKTLSAGKVFKYMYTSSSFFVMCILVTALGLLSLVSAIEAIILGNVGDYLSDAIGVIVDLVLIVPMWKMYFESKTTKATDYIKPFKFFKIYTLIRMLSVIPSLVLMLVVTFVISVDAGGDMMSLIMTVVMTFLISILPSYVAYQFACSLEKSAVSDRVILDGMSGLRTVQIIFGVLLAIATPVLIIMAFDALFSFESFATLANVLSTVIEMVIFFYVYGWLKDLGKKIEQA